MIDSRIAVCSPLLRDVPYNSFLSSERVVLGFLNTRMMHQTVRCARANKAQSEAPRGEPRGIRGTASKDAVQVTANANDLCGKGDPPGRPFIPRQGCHSSPCQGTGHSGMLP